MLKRAGEVSLWVKSDYLDLLNAQEPQLVEQRRTGRVENNHFNISSKEDFTVHNKKKSK